MKKYHSSDISVKKGLKRHCIVFEICLVLSLESPESRIWSGSRIFLILIDLTAFVFFRKKYGVYDNILEHIGNTPLVRLDRIKKEKGLKCDICK